MAITSKTSSLSSEPQALVELEIPGATGPLPEPPAAPGEALWGINHGAALDNFPLNGLQLYIKPWSPMNEGDSVAVKMDGNTVVATEVIDKTGINQRVTTFVTPERLTPGKHTFAYSVTRFSQTPESSLETEVFVKLTRPGGQDQNGDTPGHSQLILTLPDEIIRNGVDSETAKKGVIATVAAYPNMTEGDDIKVSWGGQFVHHTVTAGEAQAASPLDITIDEVTILAAGDSGDNGLAVTFEVYDVVDNRSEDWAAETRIAVNTGTSLLSSPILAETIDNVLDLDTLGDAPVTVQVTAATTLEAMAQLNESLKIKTTTPVLERMSQERREQFLNLRADFNHGDKIIVMVRGTTAEGTPVTYEAPEVTIDNLPFVYKIPVPNAIVRELTKTQAVFSYTLVHSDTSEVKSRGAFINIIGEATRLAAPVAKDASGGAIDPDLTSTTIEVPWDDSILAGDQITLKWIGTRPDFTIYDPLLPGHAVTSGEVTAAKPILMSVPGTHLKAIEGGTLRLNYLLEREVDGTIVKRESARAGVLTVGEPRAELPAPQVSDLQDGVMKPELSSATLTVPNYTGKDIGDEIIRLWKGSTTQIQDSIIVSSLNKLTPIDFTIPAAEIAPNKGAVQASYSVIRKVDGRTSYSDVTHFTIGESVVLDPPTISKIADLTGADVAHGDTTLFTTLVVTGSAPANQKVQIFDGASQKGEATANDSGGWVYTLTQLGDGAHAIKIKALYEGGAESAVRNLVVAGATLAAPTLERIKDSSGSEIKDGETTNRNDLTLHGSAPTGSLIETFDGTTPKSQVSTDADGRWSSRLPDLTSNTHIFKARALYGSGAETNTITIIIKPEKAAPRFTKVTDGNGVEIPRGGTTTSTTVLLTGHGEPGERVEIKANSVSKGTPTVDIGGVWTLTLNNLITGDYTLRVEPLYDTTGGVGVYDLSVVTTELTTTQTGDS